MKVVIGNYRARVKDDDLLESSKYFTIEEIEDINNKSVTQKLDGLIWNNNHCFYDEYFNYFPSLKFFLNWGTGIRNIPKPRAFCQRGIIFKPVDNYSTESVAEFAVRQLLTITRCQSNGYELYGKKVGIVGLSKIGFRIAQILHTAFHCEIKYCSRKNKNIAFLTFCKIEELLHDCDYVIIAVKSPDYSLSYQNLEHGHPELVIINLAEDDAAPVSRMRDAIKKKKLKLFISDSVFDQEIESTNSLIKTGHITYKTTEAREAKMALLRLILKKIHCSTNNDKKISMYFIRHGETLWNANGIYQGTNDSPLSDKGKEQVLSVANFLRDKKIRKLIASPLGRAMETANIIADVVQCPIDIVPEFREMDFGVFQGKLKEEAQALHSDFFGLRKSCKLFLPFPEGESYFDVYIRVLRQTLKLSSFLGNIAIVGHESVNRIIRGIIEERPLEEAINLRQKNNQIIEYCFDEDREIVHEV